MNPIKVDIHWTLVTFFQDQSHLIPPCFSIKTKANAPVSRTVVVASTPVSSHKVEPDMQTLDIM